MGNSKAIGCAVSAAALLSLCAAAYADTADVGKVKGDALEFRSAYLDTEIVVLPGVFAPDEAEGDVLPLMHRNREIFENKVVLEIGTGSGIISLYAAKLGAKKVIATDISEQAITTVRVNAERHGFHAIVEPRLVPLSDMSAYSVIKPEETFDIVISNPPYSLDLDAPTNDAVTDTGDLGFSIVDGLDRHLTAGGMALLYYKSAFYHHVMVKYARYSGFAVRNSDPIDITPWEVEALYNSYLARLLAREGVPLDAFRFDWREDRAATRLIGEPKVTAYWGKVKAWVENLVGWSGGDDGPQPYLNIPGWIAIQRPAGNV